jgi:hypothetical protein
MPSSGAPSPRVFEVGQQRLPGIGRLGRARAKAEEHRLAVGVDAPSHQHRLGAGLGMQLAERPVQVQVVDADPGKVAAAPGVELGPQPLAAPAHRRLADGGVLAEDHGQHGLDVAVRQPRTQQEITSVSSALVLVTPWPNSRSHRAAWAWRSLGRCNSTGPSEVFRVRGCCQPLR